MKSSDQQILINLKNTSAQANIISSNNDEEVNKCAQEIVEEINKLSKNQIVQSLKYSIIGVPFVLVFIFVSIFANVLALGIIAVVLAVFIIVAMIANFFYYQHQKRKAIRVIQNAELKYSDLLRIKNNLGSWYMSFKEWPLGQEANYQIYIGRVYQETPKENIQNDKEEKPLIIKGQIPQSLEQIPQETEKGFFNKQFGNMSTVDTFNNIPVQKGKKRKIENLQ